MSDTFLSDMPPSATAPTIVAWSFYDAATGLFTPQNLLCPAGEDPNAFADDPGHAAIAGTHDRLSQQVDLETLEVIDYQPPAPDDDELRTWAWDTGIKRWVSTLTVAGRKPAMFTTVEKQMLAIEGTEQARPTRALVLALAAAATPPADDLAQLVAVEAEVTALRGKYAAIEAASTHEDLDEIDL